MYASIITNSFIDHILRTVKNGSQQRILDTILNMCVEYNTTHISTTLKKLAEISGVCYKSTVVAIKELSKLQMVEYRRFYLIVNVYQMQSIVNEEESSNLVSQSGKNNLQIIQGGKKWYKMVQDGNFITCEVKNIGKNGNKDIEFTTLYSGGKNNIESGNFMNMIEMYAYMTVAKINKLSGNFEFTSDILPQMINQVGVDSLYADFKSFSKQEIAFECFEEIINEVVKSGTKWNEVVKSGNGSFDDLPLLPPTYDLLAHFFLFIYFSFYNNIYNIYLDKYIINHSKNIINKNINHNERSEVMAVKLGEDLDMVKGVQGEKEKTKEREEELLTPSFSEIIEHDLPSVMLNDDKAGNEIWKNLISISSFPEIPEDDDPATILNDDEAADEIWRKFIPTPSANQKSEILQTLKTSIASSCIIEYDDEDDREGQESDGDDMEPENRAMPPQLVTTLNCNINLRPSIVKPSEFYTEDEMQLAASDISACLETSDMLYIHCLWAVLNELAIEDDEDEDGSPIEIQTSPEGLLIPVNCFARDVQQPAYDMMEEIIENGFVEYKGEQIPVDLKILTPREVDRVTAFDVVDDDGEKCFQVSFSKIRNINAKPQRAVGRAELRKGREEDFAYMQAIMKIGDDDRTRDSLSPIEYAAYVFLGRFFSIGDDHSVIENKKPFITRQEFALFICDMAEENVTRQDFLGITRCGDVIKGDNGLNLIPRMFSADKIWSWNDRNGHQSCYNKV